MLPVINLDSSQIGPLGVTIDAPDNGGGNGQAALTIPVVLPPMADERQWCVNVVRAAHGAKVADFRACGSYHRGGGCALAGAGGKCAFLESPEHPVWDKARDWYHLEGVGLIHRLLWHEHGIAADGAR
jgi:hypothetical protein